MLKAILRWLRLMLSQGTVIKVAEIKQKRADFTVNPAWLRKATVAPEYIIIHHSANNDRYVIDDWTELRKYHRSFRKNWNIFASPIDGTTYGQSVVKVAENTFDLVKVKEFYKLCDKPMGSFVQERVGNDYYQSPWRDVGYNLGIEKVNNILTVQYGRWLTDVAAHCYQERMNERSIGICILGTYDLYPPDQDIWDFAVKVCKDIRQIYPGIKILGHREVKGVSKSCPGDVFNMDKFRQDVDRIV
jgi:N-acetylmuramoyl-L-alanine amidase